MRPLRTVVPRPLTGHKVYPIMWGRAQALLGRVKSKPRGSGKAAAAAKKTAKRAGRKRAAAAAPLGAKRKAARRPVGRPRKAATAAAQNGAFPVAEGDLPRMAAVVDALNAGGKAVLRYDGDEWELAVER